MVGWFYHRLHTVWVVDLVVLLHIHIQKWYVKVDFYRDFVRVLPSINLTWTIQLCVHLTHDHSCRTGMSGRVREVREGERRTEERRDGSTVGRRGGWVAEWGKGGGDDGRKRRGDEHQDEEEEKGTQIPTAFPDIYVPISSHSCMTVSPTDSKSKRKWRRSSFWVLWPLHLLSLMAILFSDKEPTTWVRKRSRKIQTLAFCLFLKLKSYFRFPNFYHALN